ncbi:hypothetical protein [Muribaculum intestinale]|uniref:Lipoprotein n=1 Tax=Muribaculum intestinale TaxID=1796646 RepID=A0A4S2FQD2_9BACT|nr:hypothetical protein [Muribaculum intestinale]MYM13224.1 hypothetical protein [Muribaculum intestinale]TGY71292.1 hypothetical protein E5333_11700 [Muribaculum intestinale]
MKPGMKLTILLISGVIIWGSIFFAIGCSNNPKERARSVAEKSLLACVDCPETVRIKAVSKPDSVFGRDYVTQDEQMNIAMAMLKINQKVMAETDNMENINLENREMTELMERQMSALSVLRSLVRFDDLKKKEQKPFNGWKVKIEYEAQSESGKPYRSEYWFILDKDATCVVNSFEIPLL